MTSLDTKSSHESELTSELYAKSDFKLKVEPDAIPCAQPNRFTPASLSGKYAPRKDLLDTYNKAAQRQFIYVHAPAGSGKTVSTMLWLQQTGMRPIWLSLDSYDNTLAVFYKQLALALLTLQPDNANMRAAVSAQDFMGMPVERTIELICALNPSSYKVALVFDDMHLIHSETIMRSLPLALKRLPENIIVVVLSRNEPSAAWSQFILDPKTNIITQEHLRFSCSEIQDYFVGMGTADAKSKSESAFITTDGWAMGVNAIAQNDNFNFDDTKRTLSYYFETSVWSIWDKRLRDFCLCTSVVDEFSVELARELSGNDNVQELLEQLLHTNSFMVQFGTNNYHFHHLFLAFLREKAAEARHIKLSQLHKKAARYYRQSGESIWALRSQINSGSFKNLDASLCQILFGDRKETIAQNAESLRLVFTNNFPLQAFDACPALYALSAWYHYLTGNHQQFESDLDAMYEKLPHIALRGRQLIEFAIAAYSTDYRTSILEKAEKFDTFRRYAHLFSAGGIGSNVVTITHNMPYLHRSNIDFSCIAADDNSLTKLEHTFAILLGSEWAYLKPTLAAGISYERNRPDDALQQLDIAQAQYNEHPNAYRLEGLVCILVLRHSLLWRQNNSNKTSSQSNCDAVLAQLNKLVRERALFFLPKLSAYATRLALYNGEKTTAKEWLESYHVVKSAQVGMLTYYQMFTTVRALVVLGDLDEASKCLQTLKDFANAFRRPLDISEVAILDAILMWANGRRNDAVKRLEQALQILAPFGFIRIIADEGAAIIPVLKRLLKTNACGQQYRTFANEALLAAHDFAKKHKGIVGSFDKRKARGLPIKLSRRQQQMLSLLATGLSNAQISHETGLAIPTIKTHLFYAYRKLEVNNSIDAILRARELGLLPSHDAAHYASRGTSYGTSHNTFATSASTTNTSAAVASTTYHY
ncbi:MAG: LuxR C-terminal-related transcriptional regulator [Coriobacteriales bacterium]|jgi:LuxR family maltose regulon positive regulatory protein|nr:LuxR C-terminal-related transcriptional regulator [Coriobacteriales bacterium]